jgi:hypothetical protein
MGCSCSTCSSPPCGFCENYSECEFCKEDVYNDDLAEHDYDIICENCFDSTDICKKCNERLETDDLTAYHECLYCDDCLSDARKDRLNIKLFGHA